VRVQWAQSAQTKNSSDTPGTTGEEDGNSVAVVLDSVR